VFAGVLKPSRSPLKKPDQAQTRRPEIILHRIAYQSLRPARVHGVVEADYRYLRHLKTGAASEMAA
jgi:hypothetical protein